MVEVAVVGAPHEELGEEVRAVVALKEGESATEEGSSPSPERGSLSILALSDLMDDLPKTENGKILKRELTDSGKVESDAAALALGS